MTNEIIEEWNNTLAELGVSELEILAIMPAFNNKLNQALENQREEMLKMFNEYKEKYPDADWLDAKGLLLGSKAYLKALERGENE